MDMIGFEGRAILVTGAGRGIGRAEAVMLAARGASVVVADNGSAMSGERPDGRIAEEVADAIRAAGGTALPCSADIATQAGAEAAVQACLDAFGRIDGIIHNASTSPDLAAPDALSMQDFDLVMRINPFAAVWMVRAAWRAMAEAGFGRIVLMPSAALYGALGNTHYAAAKAAYIGIARCLALEGAGHGILTNAIMPAARTRMTERFPDSAYARWFFETMRPEHVAAAAAYLTSDACTANGEILAAGGGRIARVAVSETEGVVGIGETIEDIRNAMPRVIADDSFFQPKDLAERSAKVAAAFGFSGRLESSDRYAVRNSAGEDSE